MTSYAKIKVKMIPAPMRPANAEQWLERMHAAQARSDVTRARCALIEEEIQKRKVVIF